MFMNKQELDILQALFKRKFVNQRMLAETSGHSLGVVNRSIKGLLDKGYLNEDMSLSDKAKIKYFCNKPRNAIILAAGYGMRLIPVNINTPKALLEINGEPLIERLIKQLHEVGIKKISVVVGFMKERFDYLVDKYGVELIMNPGYAIKNNISSLSLVSDQISNTYILPCDIWCKRNPFSEHELYSWYMLSSDEDMDSCFRVNRKREIVKVKSGERGNKMIGIACLLGDEAKVIRYKIKTLSASLEHDRDFWEVSLYQGNKMMVPAKVVNGDQVVEINTYEELRMLGESNQLKSEALDVISNVFNVKVNEIRDICVLKKGMTNRSFLFSIYGERYIMRVPGEGTDQIINRFHEAEVFSAISNYGFCDNPIYIDPNKGFKITKFLEGARTCDSNDINDLEKSMRILREFHSMKLSVPHTFDIFGQIEFYESLWGEKKSIYIDYFETKNKVLTLKTFIDGLEKDWSLTHIDAVPDNFLFYTPKGKDQEQIQLTDWEYSGMQDPHVDIAMFCIYSLYTKRQVDNLIDIYFENKCSKIVRLKIYAYISVCGLLWSNWCEFKRNCGVEFGEYSLKQYRFAKDYYNYVIGELEKNET